MTEDYAEEDENAIEEQTDDKEKAIVADYGKIAKAISNAQQNGVQISAPSVNLAELDFIPDVETNSIVYSLKAVTGVNTDLANRIIANRPYKLLSEFIEKVQPTKVQMINMIKAGCFDSIYEKYGRRRVMERYVQYLSEQEVSKKEKLTMAQFDKLVEYGMLPQKYDFARRAWKYSKYLDKNCADKPNRRYLLKDTMTLEFFNKYYRDELVFGKDYDDIPDGYAVKTAAITRVTEKYMKDLKEWLGSEEACDAFYKAEKKRAYDTVWNKYCLGTISKWEMQALHCYQHEHELAHVNTKKYNIVDFDDLPEKPTPVATKVGKNGQEYPVYDLVRICGTVINADNNKHIVTLLTHNGKVVDLKLFSGAYIEYNKVISYQDEKKVKHIVEGSWFDRGQLLLVSGVRRELSFLPKTNWDAGYKYPVQLIKGINPDGTLELKDKRDSLEDLHGRQ